MGTVCLRHRAHHRRWSVHSFRNCAVIAQARHEKNVCGIVRMVEKVVPARVSSGWVPVETVYRQLTVPKLDQHIQHWIIRAEIRSGQRTRTRPRHILLEVGPNQIQNTTHEILIEAVL